MSEDLTACMFMDEATATKYFSRDGFGGINHADFAHSVVPFAPTSDGEEIALKKYARHQRYTRVPPFLLLTIKIPARFALDHILRGEIKFPENRPEATIGFARAVNVRNYPSMLAEVQYINDPDVGEALLLEGLQLLNLGS